MGLKDEQNYRADVIGLNRQGNRGETPHTEYASEPYGRSSNGRYNEHG